MAGAEAGPRDSFSHIHNWKMKHVPSFLGLSFFYAHSSWDGRDSCYALQRALWASNKKEMRSSRFLPDPIASATSLPALQP